MVNNNPKLVRIATIPLSLNILLKGQLAFLANHFKIIAVASPGEDLQVVKEREDVITHSISIKRNISLISDSITFVKLFLFFLKEKPTIIHSITPKAGLLSMIAGKLAGVPIRMHTFTGLIFPSKKGLLKQVLIIMDKILCYCATNVYPEGNGVKNDLLAHAITTKPLKVLANGNVNGVDLTYFDPEKITTIQKQEVRTKLNIQETDFVFIFVGRLVGDKGINELVQAFSQLTNLNAKLLLVGPYESELDPLQLETLHQIKNNSNIITVGFQEDVRPYFAISHCLVFPSYREGFPNVVLQAGAMGLPSIVSNINGCNEIIEEGFNGTIVPSKNKELLYLSMQRIIRDEVWRNKLQKNARERINSHYKQQLVWEALLLEYQKIMKEKGL
ncbi:glycosyltransferase family 4 protein [Flavobacterium sp. 20NA77.7]|uniref:Glycosyltransferase family 4 protein n=1 Tax=Flavobacterium nakdongensis TaxID=3073563 RepID=A0ABY9RB01_9FLAO|nr:glycosyltransferase family 4 protein [Flavobacterium sp. 20NA77.7]WMW77366.1 glycosyltransferase family 4 protein [Flavobacterium sp. 20NA77.7]